MADVLRFEEDPIEEGPDESSRNESQGLANREDTIGEEAGPMASTPLRMTTRPRYFDGSELKIGSQVEYPGCPVELLPNMREDRQRCLFPASPLRLPPEPHPKTQAKWKDRPVKLYKYVDDALQCDRVNMENANRYEDEDCNVREKHAIQSQNLFRQVVGKAEWKGMKVNTAKTNMLCVSDALTFVPGSYISTSEDIKIASGGREDKMKLLGFHISNRPGVSAHVFALKRRLRQRFWVLIHLRSFGFTESELVQVYKTVIRPVHDYCAVVFHSQLTDEQDELLERQQSHALKLIFGPQISAGKMRERAGITTLRQRRIDLCDKFAAKTAKNPRFGHWFPVKPNRRNTRSATAPTQYLETFARCDRLRNSPLHFLRRRLNGKEGRVYGARNRERREDTYRGGDSTVAWMT